jgi:predicted PhzF superfamily epimerase YddE/YHI9
VLLLPVPRDVTWMQKVAREMNLSETAFLVQRPVLRASPRWELRSEMVHASD